ncbi:MAG: hypothetical protein DRP64_20115, partial [Verrucomicrobia bacterium]
MLLTCTGYAETSIPCTESALHLIPTPQQVDRQAGQYRFTSESTIVLDGDAPQDRFAADQLAMELRESMGLEIAIGATPKAGSILIGRLGHDSAVMGALTERGITIPENLGEEGYVLCIEPDRILLAANDASGIFYGIQTLKQLVRTHADDHAVPCCQIIDWPVLKMRGWLDDITRGPIPTLDFLKREIRTMAEYKQNWLTLYTEHVFKLEKHPTIAPDDGITAEEIKELSAYAKRYHVELVGCFQSFGHFKNILDIPEYAHLGEVGTVLSPAKEASYEFLADVYSEIAPAYPSPYFNICCDETAGLGEGASKAMVAEMGLGGVYAYHVNRIADLLKPHGKKLMMWGDIAVHHREIISQLPKDMIVLSWGYEALPSFDHVIQPFTELGFEFIVCPGVSCWNEMWPDMQKAFINISNYCRDGARLGALGMLNTTWDDDGENLFGYHWLPLLWGAECGWNPAVTAEGQDPDRLREERRQIFMAAFSPLFHGLDDDCIPALLYRLSELRQQPTAGTLRNTTFWDTRWEAKSPALVSDAEQLVQETDAIIAELEGLKPKTRLNTDTLDLAIFAACRVRFLARRELTISQLTAPKRVASLSLEIKELAAEVRVLGKEYATLWEQENRPYWLGNILKHYQTLSKDLEKVAKQTPLFLAPTSPAFLDKTDVHILFPGDPAATIRYTLDGSDAGPTSKIYSAPIHLDSATLVRAIAILPDGSRLPEVSRFYTKLQLPATFHTPLKPYMNHVPERAFDGQLHQSFFYSKIPFRDGDHFAILFDTPVPLKSIK